MKWMAALVMVMLLFVSACGNNEKDNQQDESSQKNNTEKESPEQSELGPRFSVDKSGYYKKINEIQVDHVHGLGYAGNNNTVFIASHHGLITVKDGKWYRPKGNQHDFMGFSATEKGFYSSGHPGEGSTLPNPIGLVSSTNGGENLKKLGFTGQSDFHYLTVGYNSSAIYLVNQHPNDQLGTGMYYSLNDGGSWEQSEMKGIPSDAAYLFAHPTDENKIGLTSSDGVYVSTNNGDTFERATKSTVVTAAHFTEESLLYTTAEGKLFEQSFKDKSNLKDWNSPELGQEEAIMYLAQNPQQNEEVTFITSKNNVFQTTDGGKTWVQLMDNGTI